MTMFPETNETLIARVKDLGDGASWTEFVGIYQPIVYRMARRRGLQEADALDVIQQVFVSVAKSIDDWYPISGGPPFRAWLATIARNTITNALGRRRHDLAFGGSSVIEQLNAQPDNRATWSELYREVQQQQVVWAAEQIRHEFSDDVWASFQMTAIQGLPIADVARSLRRSAGAIYVARYRVIARLKEKVQEVSYLWEKE
ncbi:MAG: sigma-70 family RNA polymerase sigma factor [Planctomycetales bacterium]|nr:sigma-70 family RNA polymerase sigma factor [Planctomycetales bacterium]